MIHTFNKVAENKNFQFFGNVNIGTDLSVLQLQNAYHIIIFVSANIFIFLKMCFFDTDLVFFKLIFKYLLTCRPMVLVSSES